MEKKFKRTRLKPETSWIEETKWCLDNEEIVLFYTKMAIKWLDEMRETGKSKEEMANLANIEPKDFHHILHGMDIRKIEEKYNFYVNRELK